MYWAARHTVRDYNMVVQLENGLEHDKICTEDDEIDYQQTCEKGKKIAVFLFYYMYRYRYIYLDLNVRIKTYTNEKIRRES